MRRFQKHTVALLAIEQLTGAVKAPAITINTSGSAEAARSVSELSAQITKIDAEIADLKSKEAAASEEEKPAITAALKALTEKKDLLSGAVKQTRDLIASGSASAMVSAIGIQTPRSDAHIEAVATTVKEIVNNIILADDTPQLCLLRLADASVKPDAFHAICVQYFERVEAIYKLKIQAAELELISEKSAPVATKEDRELRSKRVAAAVGRVDGPGAAAALSVKPKLESK